MLRRHVRGQRLDHPERLFVLGIQLLFGDGASLLEVHQVEIDGEVFQSEGSEETLVPTGGGDPEHPLDIMTAVFLTELYNVRWLLCAFL